MKRRDLFLAAAAMTLAGRVLAQATRKPMRIGVLSSTAPETRSVFWDQFRQAMTGLGWVEDRDVVYTYRYTLGDSTRFDALAAELVAEKPDLLFAATQPAALAAKRATATIPIVFAFAIEPVESGLVASLARPGGNATGLTSLGAETSTKQIELLREIRPRLKRIVVVASGTALGRGQTQLATEAAKTFGAVVHAIHYTTLKEFDGVLEAVEKSRADGVVFYGATLFEPQKVVDRMAKLRIPAIYSGSELVVAGGLLSYGAGLGENFRLAAGYVDRILKGARPADLPVQQPQAFELTVNLKTAKAQGIAIPQSILLRATRVIE